MWYVFTWLPLGPPLHLSTVLFLPLKGYTMMPLYLIQSPASLSCWPPPSRADRGRAGKRGPALIGKGEGPRGREVLCRTSLGLMRVQTNLRSQYMLTWYTSISPFSTLFMSCYDFELLKNGCLQLGCEPAPQREPPHSAALCRESPLFPNCWSLHSIVC